MIDMQRVLESDDWSVFKPIHSDISNGKCPICEVKLTQYEQGTKATIDHFRPHGDSLYTFLKCDPKNYIIMCEECNSLYKSSSFPIYEDAKRAKNIDELKNENNLLFNPARRKPTDFFEIAFKTLSNGTNILELKRKSDIHKSTYDYKRCETMINLFGLGYCDKVKYPNDDAKICRINILKQHFDTFYPMAKALKDKNKEEFESIMIEQKERLEKYGFYDFIKNKQFTINVAGE